MNLCTTCRSHSIYLPLTFYMHAASETPIFLCSTLQFKAGRSYRSPCAQPFSTVSSSAHMLLKRILSGSVRGVQLCGARSVYGTHGAHEAWSRRQISTSEVVEVAERSANLIDISSKILARKPHDRWFMKDEAVWNVEWINRRMPQLQRGDYFESHHFGFPGFGLRNQFYFRLYPRGDVQSSNLNYALLLFGPQGFEITCLLSANGQEGKDFKCQFMKDEIDLFDGELSKQLPFLKFVKPIRTPFLSGIAMWDFGVIPPKFTEIKMSLYRVDTFTCV